MRNDRETLMARMNQLSAEHDAAQRANRCNSNTCSHCREIHTLREKIATMDAEADAEAERDWDRTHWSDGSEM